MAPGLAHEEFGRMFAIQSYGDIMSTCAPMTRHISQQLIAGA